MKRTLTAAALAVLASTSFAATQVVAAPDFHSLPPTIEEVVAELYRLDAGEADAHALPVADANRLNAGEADEYPLPVADANRLNAGEADEYPLPVADANRFDAGEADTFSPVG